MCGVFDIPVSLALLRIGITETGTAGNRLLKHLSVAPGPASNTAEAKMTVFSGTGEEVMRRNVFS